MRFDQYYNESQLFLDNLKGTLGQQEEQMMTIFIQQGPEELRKKYHITDEKDWEMVFDHLVFASEVLKKCVINFLPFFKHMVLEHGPVVLRKIFDIDDAKYDPVFEKLFDLVAVAHGALYDHVFKNRDKFTGRIKTGKAKGLRKELCLQGARYDALWEEILGLLCDAVCTQIEGDQAFERGLQAFSLLISGLRQQRSLRSFSKIWEYSEKKK